MCYQFFFSSRRRHTRYIGDWSSDVCSSDLDKRTPMASALAWSIAPVLFKYEHSLRPPLACFSHARHPEMTPAEPRTDAELRSEERRVGKECRSGGQSAV